MAKSKCWFRPHGAYKKDYVEIIRMRMFYIKLWGKPNSQNGLIYWQLPTESQTVL